MKIKRWYYAEMNEENINQTEDIRSSTQSVIKYLRKAIIEGEYPANSFLPPQRQLADTMGVGQWLIRMALKQLEVEGLIESSRGRGTRVLPLPNKKKMNKIAFIHQHLNINSHKMEQYHIRNGVLQQLQKYNYNYNEFDVCNKNNIDSQNNTNAIPLFIEDLPTLIDKYNAFVFIEASDSKIIDFINDLKKRHLPTVVANLETDLFFSATCVDHENISFCAVKSLAEMGHERIAYLGAYPTTYFYGKSLDGYKKGMSAMELPIEESLIAFCDYSFPLYAYDACKKLLQQQYPPTAIVAARDSIASGTCHAIDEAGYTIGRDISVIGYDDITWDGPEKILTTFREPCLDMGIVAVEMLDERIRNGWKPPEKRILETPLIIRRSAGPVPVKINNNRQGQPKETNVLTK